MILWERGVSSLKDILNLLYRIVHIFSSFAFLFRILLALPTAC
jgi:hypothetical protein